MTDATPAPPETRGPMETLVIAASTWIADPVAFDALRTKAVEVDRQIAALTAQRDALREALELTARSLHVESLYSSHMDGSPAFEDCPNERCRYARAALAAGRPAEETT